MDRQKCKKLAGLLEKELKVLESKLGVSINMKGGIGYDDFSMTCKLELIDTDAVGDNVTGPLQLAVQQNETFNWFPGLTTDMIGKKFTIRGEEYEFIGIKPKAKKYPIILKRLSNGNSYKFRWSDMEVAMNAKAKSEEFNKERERYCNEQKENNSAKETIEI